MSLIYWPRMGLRTISEELPRGDPGNRDQSGIAVFDGPHRSGYRKAPAFSTVKSRYGGKGEKNNGPSSCVIQVKASVCTSENSTTFTGAFTLGLFGRGLGVLDISSVDHKRASNAVHGAVVDSEEQVPVPANRIIRLNLDRVCPVRDRRQDCCWYRRAGYHFCPGCHRRELASVVSRLES